jgi:sulfur relay (sulfurtransferase) DsrC/TusE family protein
MKLERKSLINPNFRMLSETFGRTHTKVTIVDDFYGDPDQLRALALSQEYRKPENGSYPGHHGSVPFDFSKLLSHLKLQLKLPLQKYRLDTQFAMMLSSEQSRLSQEQRMPHTDSYNNNNYGGIIYLNPKHQCSGGTAFYRHAGTGLEAVNLSHLRSSKSYREKVISILSINEEESKKKNSLSFIKDSDPDWKVIKLIEMKYNRLVLFPANRFHAVYSTAKQFGNSQKTARLTQVFFLSEKDKERYFDFNMI